MDNAGSAVTASDNSALYLYGVVYAHAHDGSPLTVQARGLDGASIQVISHDGVAVLAHACPPAPYEGDAPAVHAWVLAQHEVISEAFNKAGVILPIRFDSIIAPTDRPAEQVLVSWLEHSHDAIAERLGQLAGRVELGVQILSAATLSGAARAGKPAAPGQARGRNYFQAQMAERKERERIRASEDMLAARSFEELNRLSEDISLNPKRGTRELAGPDQSARVLLDVAVLVAREGIAAIGDYLGDVAADPNVKVRFTGPWPPYSFVGALDMPTLMSAAPEQSPDHGGQKNE